MPGLGEQWKESGIMGEFTNYFFPPDLYKTVLHGLIQIFFFNMRGFPHNIAKINYWSSAEVFWKEEKEATLKTLCRY